MSGMKDSGFEWIGDIPDAWKIFRIKDVADVIMGQSPDSKLITDSGLLPFMQGNAEFGEETPHPEKFCESPHKKSRSGDILMSVRAPVGALNISDREYGIGRGLCSIKPVGIHHRFLWYFLIKSEKDFGIYANGSTFDALTVRSLNNTPLVAPNIDTQKLISAFLDERCSAINLYIEKIKKQIGLLKEYKKFVITEAVTKGLNSNVPMRDSGIEWIGPIPENWKVYRMSHLYRDIYDPGSNSLPYLTVSINNGISNRELGDDEQDRIFVRTADSSKNKRVQANDLAYNMMRAWQGAFGAAEVDGMVSSAYVVARPITHVSSKYVEHLLRTPSAMEEIRRRSHGIADFRLRLYWSQFKEMRAALPEYSEQLRVVDVLGKMSSSIESVIYKKKEIIERMNDYKRSLIYEYVTGKRQVGSES